MVPNKNKGLQRIQQVSDFIVKILKYILFILLVVMVITVFANVVGRYFFSTSLNWADEVSRAAFVWLVFIGVAVTMWDRGHIGLGNVVSRISQRAGKIADVVSSLLVLIFSLYVLVGGFKLVSLTLVQMTEYLSISTGYIYSIVPFGAMLMVFISLRDLIGALSLKGEE